MEKTPSHVLEGKINVLKRYLHILALVQYNPVNEFSESSKYTKLAELISKDEIDKKITRYDINEYITKNIKGNLNIDIDVPQGNRPFSIAEDLDFKTQLMIARIYSNFVIKDTSRDIALSKYIKAMPDRALWTLARIYFAVLEKRVIQIDYTRNDGKKIKKWVTESGVRASNMAFVYIICLFVQFDLETPAS